MACQTAAFSLEADGYLTDRVRVVCHDVAAQQAASWRMVTDLFTCIMPYRFPETPQ